MVYYFLNFAVHSLISLFLLFIMLHYVSVLRAHKAKRGFVFIFPVIITLVFLFQVTSSVIPRALDCIYILKSEYTVSVGTVQSVGYLNHSIVVGDETYYFNPFAFKPQKGDELIIKYTPNSRYAIDLEPAFDDQTESD